MPVVPRGERSFFGPGMIGQALAHAGGLVPTVERLGTVAPAKSIGPPRATNVGSASEQEVTGSGVLSIEITAGVYVFTGIVQVTYSEATTDGYVRSSIDMGAIGSVGEQSATVTGDTGTVNSATAVGGRRVDTASTVSFTPTLSAASGGAGTVVTTLRATRIAEA